jgi:long-subunit acyl-CoA synthetase (AMP-forming)
MDFHLGPEDVFLSYLPLSHVAEQMTTIHGPLFAGYCIAFAESMEKLPENLREIRPTIFLGVPRVWEKIQSKIQEKAVHASAFKKQIAKWARKVGLKYGQDTEKNSVLSYQLADKLVYSKVRKALGLDRCKMQITGAAPISKNTLEFFLSLGIPLYELYGMSECTGPATVSNPEHFKTGTAGPCIKGAELKIGDDGEILIRGRHVFLGYLNDEAATKEVLDRDGWLHSGDLGELDSNGYLTITGRKKNLIITAGGENIAPEMIENKLKTIPEIEQAVVVGDRRKFLTALITLTPEALQLAKKKEIHTSAKDVLELTNCDKFYEYLANQIEEINGGIARVQTIKNFRVLPSTFSEETGELTPTMKIKRGVVLKKYATEIEAMY